MDVPKHSIEGYEKFNLYKKVGEHSFELPDKPPIEEIENVNLPKLEQYFRPVKFPRDFDRWTAEEKEAFEEREMDRIENGFWFFNNGNLEYITGYHYFYITYWTIKMTPDEDSKDFFDHDFDNFKLGKKTKGRKKRRTKKVETPKFVDVDRDFFLLWDFVESNPFIVGLVFVTNRRDGKSYKGALIAYLTATLNSDSLVGIQSKTEKDAKSILNKAVDAWQKLPYVFKPKDNGELNPQKALKFKPPSKKATKISIEDRETNDEYINSEINYGSVNSFYYDGQDLTFYFLDEAGKTTESDVYETQQVVKEALSDGSFITGKMYITSTVEEMEKKGGKNLYEIWKASDTKTKTQTGRTNSGCIRYFKPAYMGFRGVDDNGVPFINKYGYTDWRRAKSYLEKERASRKGETLLGFMRRYPFTEEEAFQIGLQTCWFNEENIKKTLKYNEARVTGDTLMRGDFVWSAETDKPSVEFHEHEEGKFLVSWLPKPEERNLYKGFQSDEDGSFQRMPTLNKIVGGCDPFDNKETSDGRKSDGGFHLFRKFNPMAPEGESNTFVCEYIHRPAAPQIFREDVLKAAIFYSAMVLIEKNKYGIITHFEEHGWKGYLMKRPDPTHTEWSEKNEKDPYGIPLSGEHAREYLIGTLQNYIDKYIGFDENHNLKTFMPFDRTLDDWLKFNPRKWTDFDATVSSGLALMAAESKKEVEQEDILEGLLMTFDNSGEVSKLIKN